MIELKLPVVKKLIKTVKREGQYYEYEENEPHDMLNVFDPCGTFRKEADDYRAFIQNVDAGVYIVVAKHYEVISSPT